MFENIIKISSPPMFLAIRYRIWQNIRGGKLSRFSQIFTLTANVFPCMFYTLVALIHYSDQMMALTASPRNFSSKRYFFLQPRKFSPSNVLLYTVSLVASYLHIQLYNLIMSMFTCVTMLMEVFGNSETDYLLSIVVGNISTI